MIEIASLTPAELHTLRAAIDARLAEIESATSKPTRMRVALEFGSYNSRRYGRPWIGRVTSWPVGGRPEIEWGNYCGDDGGGEAEIVAQPGDLVRAGQKDNRQPRNTSNDWYLVQADGTLLEVTQPQARQAWESRSN